MGQEFLVNTYQNNWQFNPDIVTFADGGFLVTWDSYFNNYEDNQPTLTYVAGQRYDVSGRRVGSEIVLDAIDGSVSENASVTRLADGGYVMVSIFDNYDDILTTRTRIYATVYNADGTERRASFLVDTVAANNAVSPEVVALGNGGFRISFGVDRSTIDFDDVYARNYDRLGQPTGIDTLLNPNQREFDQGPAESAQLRDGTTITIWRSEASFELGTDLDANEIRGTLTDANGRVVRSDFSLGQAQGTITSAPFGNSMGLAYDVTGLIQGGFVVSHVRNADDVGVVAPDFSDSVVIRYFDGAGNLVAGDRPVYTTDEIVFNTSVTQLTSGHVVVVWEQYGEGQVGTDILARVLTSTGSAVTGVFEVGVDADSYDSQANPVVRALAGGGFVVAYESDSIDNDNEGIAARIYGRATAGNDIVTVDESSMMMGLAGNDTITGNLIGNLISGDAGNDSLVGLAGSDRLLGGIGNDVLSGGDGNDTLTGGLGRDVLSGSSGVDYFVFAEQATAANFDRITSFGTNDFVRLDNAIFAALGATGALTSGLFKMIGTGLTADSNDRLIYDQSTGILYYDTNGSGSGGSFAIVDFDTRPLLTASDFLVI